MYEVNPCPDDFTLDENRMCSICKRVVVDLTDKSDEEVIQLYNISGGNLCGSAKSSYFNRSYYLHPFKRFAFSLLLVFGSSLFIMDAVAQDSIQAIQQEVKNDSINEDTYLIKGRVLDEEGEVVFSAKVYVELNGQLYGCNTNLDGEFKINIPIEKWSSNSLMLICKSIEFGSKVIQLSESDTKVSHVDIVMDNPPELMMVGMIFQSHIIDRSADAHRSTTITSKEINRLPRR